MTILFTCTPIAEINWFIALPLITIALVLEFVHALTDPVGTSMFGDTSIILLMSIGVLVLVGNFTMVTFAESCTTDERVKNSAFFVFTALALIILLLALVALRVTLLFARDVETLFSEMRAFQANTADFIQKASTRLSL